MFKDNQAKFKKFIVEMNKVYGFEGPIHVTDFSNFVNILNSNRLCSRHDAKGFMDSADEDVMDKAKENLKKCVRMYYRPKTPTFYNNEGIKRNNMKPHMPIPVCFILHPKLIFSDATVFSDGNATNCDTSFGATFKFFQNIDWSKVFHEGYFPPEYRNEYIRKRNAELLCKKPIALEKNLWKIVFRCEADRKRVLELVRVGNIPADFARFFTVDTNMFYSKTERNYLKDYTFKYEDDQLILQGEFCNNSHKIFSHRCVVYDVNGNVLSNRKLDFSKVNTRKFNYRIEIQRELCGKIEYYLEENLCLEMHF